MLRRCFFRPAIQGDSDSATSWNHRRQIYLVTAFGKFVCSGGEPRGRCQGSAFAGRIGGVFPIVKIPQGTSRQTCHFGVPVTCLLGRLIAISIAGQPRRERIRVSIDRARPDGRFPAPELELLNMQTRERYAGGDQCRLAYQRLSRRCQAAQTGCDVDAISERLNIVISA